uniref:ATP-dependent Clp protease proteolytic subunit n=1 Tax=Brassica oleracea TaxID=3712 RepID=A0A3P6EYH2_BRAOL|nr:unnamed protein product [Brassica oleracea]
MILCNLCDPMYRQYAWDWQPNSIFYPSRRRNYQRYSIPSCLAPMIRFYEAQTGEVILEVLRTTKTSQTITRVYVQRTGKPIWVVSEDMERDVFMSATEAQAHGIVDLVAVQ